MLIIGHDYIIMIARFFHVYLSYERDTKSVPILVLGVLRIILI